MIRGTSPDAVRLRYARDVAIVRFRLENTMSDTVAKFGLSKLWIRKILQENADLVQACKAKLEQEVIEGLGRDLQTIGR